MEITDEQLEEAKQFIEHYVNIVDNHRETLIYYLTDCASFDWFGKTIKGEKNIKNFIRDTISTVQHDFSNPCPVPKIGFRDSHKIKFSQEIKPRPTKLINEILNDGEKTPPNPEPVSACSSHEEGQGDGLHNCPVQGSPTKKIRLDLGDCVIGSPKIKYIRAEGFVKFRKRSDKKLQRETKWSRPCKLEIAYSGTKATNFTIHLVIYQGNMKCRRNLLKDFDAAQDASD